MKLNISAEDLNLLKREQIEVKENGDYSIDEALDLLQAVYDVEAMYSDLPENDPRAGKANEFARLADKLSTMIPEA